MSEKPLEDMTPDEIEGLLIEGISKGHMEFAGMKDGEPAVSLTKQGEDRVRELLGGVDVAEVTHVFYNVLVKHGALGFSVEPNFRNFIIIASIMSAVKYYQTWDELVKATSK